MEWVLSLAPNAIANSTMSMSDDLKENENRTDDKKSGLNTKGWCYQFKLMLEHEQLHLTEKQLLTVAAAARSSPGIQQLIDCGLPALLTNSITGKILCKILYKYLVIVLSSLFF